MVIIFNLFSKTLIKKGVLSFKLFYVIVKKSTQIKQIQSYTSLLDPMTGYTVSLLSYGTTTTIVTFSTTTSFSTVITTCLPFFSSPHTGTRSLSLPHTRLILVAPLFLLSHSSQTHGVAPPITPITTVTIGNSPFSSIIPTQWPPPIFRHLT